MLQGRERTRERQRDRGGVGIDDGLINVIWEMASVSRGD